MTDLEISSRHAGDIFMPHFHEYAKEHETISEEESRAKGTSSQPITNVRIQASAAAEERHGAWSTVSRIEIQPYAKKEKRIKAPHNVACKLRLWQEIRDFQNKQK